MIKPLNNHVLIQPVPKDSFVATVDQKYEEIGIVLVTHPLEEILNVGDKVFFDSWMAAKYPKEGTNEFIWLVPYESIRAYEQQVPKE